MITRTTPDLTIKKLTADKSFVRPGEKVDFDIEVRNQGKADAGACSLLLDGGYDGSVKVQFEPLPAGGSRVVRVEDLIIQTSFDTHGFTAFIDSDKQIPESSERNNKKSLVLWDPSGPWPPGPFPPGPPPVPPPHKVDVRG